jgi:hypothetical protein
VAHGPRDWDAGILQHHSVKEFFAHLAFEGLVVANIDWLDKPCHAAGGDELDLHTKGLDGIDD